MWKTLLAKLLEAVAPTLLATAIAWLKKKKPAEPAPPNA